MHLRKLQAALLLSTYFLQPSTSLISGFLNRLHCTCQAGQFLKQEKEIRMQLFSYYIVVLVAITQTTLLWVGLSSMCYQLVTLTSHDI